MAYRIYIFDHCTNSVTFSKLLLVDCCLHAFLHHWRFRRDCFKHYPDIPCCCRWFPRCWARPYHVLGKCSRVFSRGGERSGSSWSYPAFHGSCKFRSVLMIFRAMLRKKTDCLDILLRINSICCLTRLPRLFRSEQGA